MTQTLRTTITQIKIDHKGNGQQKNMQQ